MTVYGHLEGRREHPSERMWPKEVDRSAYIVTGTLSVAALRIKARGRLPHECIQPLCECASLLERRLREWVCAGCGEVN